jgi:hypothetical protein
MLPLSVPEDEDMEGAILRRVGNVVKVMSPGGPYNADIVQACTELNANVGCLGLGYKASKALVAPILGPLVELLAQLLRLDAAPSAIIVTVLQTLERVCVAQHA